MPIHTLKTEEVAKRYNLDVKRGLESSAVENNRRKYGKNVITPKKKKSFIKRLIEALSEPTLVILEFAWAITLGVNIGKFLKTGTCDVYECLGILLAILLSAFLTLFMEGKSEKAFEMLGKVYDKVSIKVLRNGNICFVPKEDVVCGDIVFIETGDKIIADGRLIESCNLQIDESMLTGESKRVEKDCTKIFKDNTPLAERTNMVYSGTLVGGGNGKMIVTAVGDNAELGKIAISLDDKENISSPLNEKLNRLGKTITLIGGISAGVVFILTIFRLILLGNLSFFTAQSAFLEAIVLIVAAVPEGLPTTAAISLSLNVVKLAKSNALIRKLVAAETTGCVSIICSDKTGTLTQNQMSVERLEMSTKEKMENLELNFAINSTAQLEKESKGYKIFGSATEGALLKWLSQNGKDYEKMRDKRLIGRVLPFNSANKYMITEYLGYNKKFLIKGAPEIIISDSNLSSREKAEILRQIESYQKQGKRVIAFSSVSGDKTGIYSNNLDLCLSGGIADFDGYAVISDPVRKGVKKSVELCKTAGVDVMMMTGDNKETAKSIGFALGIINSEKQVIHADEIENLTEKQLAEKIKNIKVVARSTPSTKLKIVQALKKNGEVVAVTGDGVNDAPAIKHADVGIAMGSGSEITKEASDVVLLDDSFSTIVRAISFGRNIYHNFQRFITFQLTVNIVAMVVVIISLIVGLENPFTAVQLLWIDIIMDGPPALTLAMERDNGQYMREKTVRRSDGIINFTMLCKILLQGLFMAIVIIAQYLYDFLGVGYERVKTSVFCLFVIFQLFNAFNCRKTGSDSVFADFGRNKVMTAVFVATFLFQIVITQYLCGFFSTLPLTPIAWIKIIATCGTCVVFSEGYKLVYRIMAKYSPIKIKKPIKR